MNRYSDVHICVRLLKDLDCNTKFITWRFVNAIIEHQEINVDFIQFELRKMYGIKVGVTKTYKVNKKALERNGAYHKSNYRLIRSYA